MPEGYASGGGRGAEEERPAMASTHCPWAVRHAAEPAAPPARVQEEYGPDWQAGCGGPAAGLWALSYTSLTAGGRERILVP